MKVNAVLNSLSQILVFSNMEASASFTLKKDKTKIDQVDMRIGMLRRLEQC